MTQRQLRELAARVLANYEAELVKHAATAQELQRLEQRDPDAERAAEREAYIARREARQRRRRQAES